MVVVNIEIFLNTIVSYSILAIYLISIKNNIQ